MANALTLGEYYFGLKYPHTKGKGLGQHLKDKFMTENLHYVTNKQTTNKQKNQLHYQVRSW